MAKHKFASISLTVPNRAISSKFSTHRVSEHCTLGNFKKIFPSPKMAAILNFRIFAKNGKTQFYCEKYTYHFLTIAICWCHPTHWPTLRNVLRNLKRPVSECELACPPSGHVTTLVNNLHYFCWPSQSVDVFFLFGFFI